jgi:hypothetical protein
MLESIKSPAFGNVQESMGELIAPFSEITFLRTNFGVGDTKPAFIGMIQRIRWK